MNKTNSLSNFFFSIKNIDTKKVITIFGIKIKLKNKLKELQKKFNQETNTLKAQIVSLRYIQNLFVDTCNLPPAKENVRNYQLRLIEFAKILIPDIEKNGFHPMLTGGNLLGATRNGCFIPWDDDFDFDLVREEFDRLVDFVKEKYIWMDTKNCGKAGVTLRGLLCEYIKKYPNQIVFALKPTCLSAYIGDSFKNTLTIDFFPRDFINSNLDNEKYTNYRHSFDKAIKNFKSNGEYFELFKRELKNQNIYKKDSSMTAKGWGSCGFVKRHKTVMVPKDAVLPYSKIKFENIEFYTYAKPFVYLKSMYNNYDSIPNDIQPLKTIKNYNDFLKKRGEAFCIDTDEVL